MTDTSCLICDRIQFIQNKTNPYFVKELETGYVVIGDSQFYKGYTLFLCKQHQPELHLLDEGFRRQFLWEMSVVAQAVFAAFQPRKLNYELLGNTDSHMHWHLYPRYEDDPDPGNPVWSFPKALRVNENTKATEPLISELKEKLFREFKE